MSKKILYYVVLGLLVIGLVKALFFSGITQPYEVQSFFTTAKEPGLVWASAGTHYKRGRLGEYFLGQHYRDVWSTPVKAPVLDISKINGGLKVGKLGGGMQTTNLNLIGPAGQNWVIRSMDKDPIKVLPPFGQKTFIADLIRDQISASNPYAALVVAQLAEAAAIFHANPSVVFVSAADPYLQQHRGKIGNKLVLMEEKYTSKSINLPQFTGATAILNSLEMLENRYCFSSHRIDQLSFAQCRLFDLFIGDWDRHEGQWMWAAYPSGDKTLYKPIPKDRDQAFSLYQDGVVPWLLTRNFALRKFGHFDYKLNDIADYLVNASFIDERALNAVTLAEFTQLARQLQIKLTDEVIEAAVQKLPPPIYKIRGAELADKLKSRRKQLVQVATQYYKILAKQVVIVGTDEQEKFEVIRRPNGQTLVNMYQLTPGEAKGALVYQRLFNNTETQSVTLHGLAANDVFTVSGKVKAGIVVKIVGGRGEDFIADYSVVEKGENNTVVIDTKKGNTIIWGPQTENKTSSDLSVHNYDREGF